MEGIQNQVEFDRVTDKPLSGRIIGTFNSTQRDEHGHVITENLYPGFIESMKQYPERRIVSINHNRDDPMGEILWAGILKGDDVIRLVGEVGLYEDVEHREDEIENLGGFSVSLVGYENIDEELWDPNQVNFKYVGLGEDYHRWNETVVKNGVPARFEVQKSAAGAFLVDAVANNFTLLIELALVAYSINRERKKSEEEQETEPKIVVNQTNIFLEGNDIDKFLEELSEAIGEDVKLDSDQAEQLVKAIEDEDATVEFEVSPEYE